MTNPLDLVHRYRWTTAYVVYVVYVALVFHLAGLR